MRNVTSECVLFVPRIYSSLREGYGNEDFRYALLVLAVEVVSFILDLKGGSQWGYLLASFLLSVLILETTIYAFFIKRSTIKSEGQQLIAVEIVFSLLQLVISGYCLIKTLSGVETNYSSSVFPLAYATISVVFTFKSKKDVSQSSSNTPSNQVGIVEGTGESVLESIKVDPPDPTLVSVPAIDADVDPPDPTLVSVPASDANCYPPDPTSVSVPASDANVGPADPTSVFVPASDANVGPPDPTSVSVPASDANVNPRDPNPVSVPASDADVDPPDPTLVPVPESDAKVPHANELRRRNKQTQLSTVNEQTRLKELVFKVDLSSDKAKKKAIRKLTPISGVESIKVNMNEKKLTLIATGEVDPAHVLNKLRRQRNTELISVGPAKQSKMMEEKQSAEKKNFNGFIRSAAENYPAPYSAAEVYPDPYLLG